MTRTGEGPTASDGERPPFGLRPLNVGLLASGLVAIAAGYVLLSRGSTVAAPLLLVAGYAVFVPAALLVGLRGAPEPDEHGGE